MDKKINQYNLASDLEHSFNQIGASMMSDEFAAKLLAYVYVFGGGNEAVVMHEGLNAGIAIAQRKANLFGGEVPNKEMVRLIQKYTAELNETDLETPWLNEIYSRYNLKVPS